MQEARAEGWSLSHSEGEEKKRERIGQEIPHELFFKNFRSRKYKEIGSHPLQCKTSLDTDSYRAGQIQKTTACREWGWSYSVSMGEAWEAGWLFPVPHALEFSQLTGLLMVWKPPSLDQKILEGGIGWELPGLFLCPHCLPSAWHTK